MPRNHHGHHNRLASACGHLERCAEEKWVGFLVFFPYLALNPACSVFGGHLGDIDSGLKRLYLTKEQLLFPLGFGPIFKELGCGPGHMWIAPFAPLGNPIPHLVHEFIFFDSVLGPLCVQLILLPLFLGFGDRNEVRTGTAAFNDLVSNPFLRETKVTAWFLVRGVDYGILDDYLFHGAILSVIRWGRKRFTPTPLIRPGKSSGTHSVSALTVTNGRGLGPEFR